MSVAPRADTLAPRPVDRGPDPPLVTPPLPAPGAAGVMAAGVVGAGGCQTRPAPPPLAPEPAPLLVGVAPLAAAGGVLGTATFARSAATRPPPPRVCGPPPPANGPGAAPPDWASRAFMRSLIDIVAMPSVASSDIDKWGHCESAARAASGGGTPSGHAARVYMYMYLYVSRAGPKLPAAFAPQTRAPARRPADARALASGSRAAAASRHAHDSRTGHLVSAARRSRLPAPARQAQAREHRPMLTRMPGVFMSVGAAL